MPSDDDTVEEVSRKRSREEEIVTVTGIIEHIGHQLDNVNESKELLSVTADAIDVLVRTCKCYNLDLPFIESWVCQVEPSLIGNKLFSEMLRAAYEANP